MRTLQISVEERKSIGLLEGAFILASTPLPEGDLAWEDYLIELKIEEDGLDFARMGDELTRMSATGKKGHIIWVWNEALAKHSAYHRQENPGVIFTEDVMRFYSLAQQAGIFAHLCPQKEKLAAKVDQILSGKYDRPLQMHRKPSRKLSTWARLLCCYPGITEPKAIAISDKIPTMASFVGCNQCDKLAVYEILCQELGRKKDGSAKKIVIDFLTWAGILH